MTPYKDAGGDLVSRLIGYCHQDPHKAQELFDSLIANRSGAVRIAGEEFSLNAEERGEFVARYSAEVEPTLWESKRRKQ